MKVYELETGCTSLEGLRRRERPDPEPSAQQVVIRVRAASLNARDQAVLAGKDFHGAVKHPVIPLSDGAGEVVAAGPAVTRFKPGDRVAGTFFQVWIDGQPPEQRSALGYPMDGMLAEYALLHEDGIVAIPGCLSFEEAATLPCAAVTAWNALMATGKAVKPGDTVLCLGTGGVSMFALDFAKSAGARVIVTSSSTTKLERVLSRGGGCPLVRRK